MMTRLDFCNKWIRGCLESSTISVLVNGSPTEQFSPTKGLRQGDPLAPLLFLIVVEGLAGVVRQAEYKGLLEGINVGKKQIPINMLRFADDTIFVCSPKTQNIVVIKSILRCFEITSGLKVNFRKTKRGSIDRMIERFSIMLNCMTMNIPFLYLGIKVGANHRKKVFWNDMIINIRKRLSKWKGRHLSSAGRVMLIKSVISYALLNVMFYLFIYMSSPYLCVFGDDHVTCYIGAGIDAGEQVDA